MRAHALSIRATAMIAVASTIAMDGGSAEYAGATILPRIMHQPSVIISPTCTT